MNIAGRLAQRLRQPPRELAKPAGADPSTEAYYCRLARAAIGGDFSQRGTGCLLGVAQYPAGNTLFGAAKIRRLAFDLAQHVVKIQK